MDSTEVTCVNQLGHEDSICPKCTSTDTGLMTTGKSRVCRQCSHVYNIYYINSAIPGETDIDKIAFINVVRMNVRW